MWASRLKLSAALPAELVTTFQAARPRVRWSIEANVRATWYGSPKLVETVAPRPMCRVEAESAEMSVVGSKRQRNEGWSPGSMTSPSETNKRSNFPRSAWRAISWIAARSLLLVAAPSQRHPAEWLPVPRTNTPKCISRRAAPMDVTPFPLPRSPGQGQEHDAGQHHDGPRG